MDRTSPLEVADRGCALSDGADHRCYGVRILAY